MFKNLYKYNMRSKQLEKKQVRNFKVEGLNYHISVIFTP